MGTPRGKYKESIWKGKLKVAQKEKRTLKQAVKRLKEQNAKVKAKNQALKKEKQEYEKAKAAEGEIMKNIKPGGYKYAVWLIKMAISLQVSVGLSYRQASACIEYFIFLLEIEMSSPCASTIRQWVQKSGVYKLNYVSKEAKLEEQVLIIDESAGIGQEKAFLVLGVDIENWKKRPKSLQHRDTQVLGVGTRKSWDGSSIKKVLEQIKQEHEGKIKYVVSDGGGTMRKGCEISSLIRVLDCTHWMANCLERYYKKEEEFQELQKHLGKVRQKMVNGRKVWMIAPSLRSKARFLNLFGIVAWMEKIESVWGKLTKDEREAVAFLKEHSELVKELICMIKIIRLLSTLLKTKGITSTSEVEVLGIFASAGLRTETVKRFEEDMLKYIKEIIAALPEEKCILCCSDVIESYFGKLKYRDNKRASQGITEDVLVLPLFNDDLTEQSILEAMTSTSWRDVNLWVSQNMVDSFIQTKQKGWRKLVSKTA